MSRRELRKDRRNNTQKEFFQQSNQNQYQLQRDLYLQETYQDIPQTSKKTLSALNKKQKEYINLINTNQIIIATGSAGTGKTFIPVMMAINAFKERQIKKIVLTRPAVEACGENLGFLKGDLFEKYQVYLEPFLDIFEEQLGLSFTEYCIKTKKIDPKPLAFLRGKTFTEDTWVLADEMQNCNPAQMLMLLTRLNSSTKLIITGDLNQRDRPNAISGLYDAINKLEGVPGVAFINFSKEDIVRSDIVQAIIERYEE